jgi:hypothetical protein
MQRLALTDQRIVAAFRRDASVVHDFNAFVALWLAALPKLAHPVQLDEAGRISFT